MSRILLITYARRAAKNLLSSLFLRTLGAALVFVVSAPYAALTANAASPEAQVERPADAPRSCGSSDYAPTRISRRQPDQAIYGTRPAPHAIRIGAPTEDLSTSLAFGWMTDDRTLASSVEVQAPDGTITRITGESFSWSSLTATPPRRRMHEVHVCGLQPHTAYTYRVGGEAHWSPWKTIRTLPPAGSDAPWKAIIFGDSRSSTRVFGQLAQQVAQRAPDVVFFPGDIVGDGRQQVLWDPWFAAGTPMLESTIFIPVIGNHEYQGEPYFGQFALPNDERYFLLPIGRTHWAAWDDDGTITRLLNFILPRTAALFSRIPADVERLILLHHQPMYSASGHGSDRNLREHVLPWVEQLVPDLVFNAHCHNYERSCRIAGDTCVDADTPGTRYIVSAGAGANLRPAGREWFTHYAQSSYHFVELTIEGTKIDAQVHAIDGSIIESWSLEAPFSRSALPSTFTRTP